MALDFGNGYSATPTEVFAPDNPKRSEIEVDHGRAIRRGRIIWNEPESVARGKGVLTRIDGNIYQIDIYVPRHADSAFKIITGWVKAHIDHFFPPHGRGLTLSLDEAWGHIKDRPAFTDHGRRGEFLHFSVDVDWYTEIKAET